MRAGAGGAAGAPSVSDAIERRDVFGLSSSSSFLSPARAAAFLLKDLVFPAARHEREPRQPLPVPMHAWLAFSLPGVSEPRASRPHGREGGLSSDLVHWNILRERHLRSLPPHQSGSALQVSCGSFLSSEESLPDAAPLSRFCPLGILHKFIFTA